MAAVLFVVFFTIGVIGTQLPFPFNLIGNAVILLTIFSVAIYATSRNNKK
jgi:hypothetical protein